VSENITPPETTTPPVIATPPAVTPASENITPPETTTPSVVAGPPAVTTTSENITPPATTTQDKGKTSKTDKLWKSLGKSNNQSLQALKDAKEKASQKAKDDWQKTIDTMKKSQNESQHDKGITSQSDNVTQTIQSDNNTAPSSTGSSDNKSSSSKWRNSHR